MASEQRYVCEVCHREGPMGGFQDACRPGWTHGRLLKISSTAQNALLAARLETLLPLLAREGAARCGYAPGAGDPEKWPAATCDCKYVSFVSMPAIPRSSEQTGCAEVRTLYRLIEADLEKARR